VRPAVAAALDESTLELVNERCEVAHIVGRVLELRGLERAAAPVGERLVVVQAHLQHGVEQPVEARASGQADEAGGDLRVVDVGRHRAEVQAEGDQISGRRVHQLLHGGIGDQLAERLERRALKWVDQPDRLADSHLHEAQLRGVGLLPEELGVERTAPGGPSSGGDLVDAGGVDDHARELGHAL
jgi:chorismate mutase